MPPPEPDSFPEPSAAEPAQVDAYAQPAEAPMTTNDEAISPEPIEAEPEAAVDPLADAPAEQPAGSTITFIPTPDSLTFAIPRTGFRGVALFFLIFSLFWDGITFPMVAIFLATFFREPSFEEFLVLAFLSIFVFIGVAMALAAIQTAFRRAVILATRDALIYTQSGPIRNREFQWKPSEIQSIGTDYSGTTVNGRRFRELRIITKDGKKQGFFDGRDDNELAWLARTIRDFYPIQ